MYRDALNKSLLIRATQTFNVAAVLPKSYISIDLLCHCAMKFTVYPEIDTTSGVTEKLSGSEKMPSCRSRPMELSFKG